MQPGSIVQCRDRESVLLPSDNDEVFLLRPLTGANDEVVAAHLLWQAARLTLREGAPPFRSLGRISIRPRTYQFVPLLMALRLDPIRMLVADDVGAVRRSRRC